MQKNILAILLKYVPLLVIEPSSLSSPLAIVSVVLLYADFSSIALPFLEASHAYTPTNVLHAHCPGYPQQSAENGRLAQGEYPLRNPPYHKSK